MSPISRCGCDSGSCACVVQGGDNVTVTGTGSVETPYIVSSAPVTQDYLEAYHAAEFSGGTVPWTGTDLVKKTGSAVDLVNDPDWGGWTIKVLADGLYVIESNWIVHQANDGAAAVELQTVHVGPAPDFNDADTRRHSQRSVDGFVAGVTWYIGHTTFYSAVVGDYFFLDAGNFGGTLTFSGVRLAVARAR